LIVGYIWYSNWIFKFEMYFGPNQHGFLLFLSNFISFICSLHLYRVWQRRLFFYTFKNFERSRTSVPVRIPFRFFFIKIKQNIFKNRESGESITVIFQLSSPAFYFLWVSQLLKNVVNILEYIPVGYSS
jgi:hypothetical protein